MTNTNREVESPQRRGTFPFPYPALLTSSDTVCGSHFQLSRPTVVSYGCWIEGALDSPRRQTTGRYVREFLDWVNQRGMAHHTCMLHHCMGPDWMKGRSQVEAQYSLLSASWMWQSCEQLPHTPVVLSPHCWRNSNANKQTNKPQLLFQVFFCHKKEERN